MKPASLILLQGDLTAQRLVVSWPLLSTRPKKASTLTDAQIAQWRGLAGLPGYTECKQRMESLIAHGIVLPDGSVDALAEAFIQNIATRGITRAKQKQT